MKTLTRYAAMAALATATVVFAGCSGGSTSSDGVGDASAESATAVAEWYVARGEGRDGPMTEAELRAGMSAGSIQPDDQVWRDGMADWMSADSVLRSVLGLGETDEHASAFLALCTRAAALPDRDVETLEWYTSDDSHQVTEAQVRSVLTRHQAFVSDARNAAKTPGLIELDYTQGANLLLPHLSTARRMAKVLRADARLASQDGRHADAAADCAALGRIARQLTTDRVTLSSLVAIAITDAFREACLLLDETAISSPDLQEIARWLNGNDPFNLAAGLQTERDFFLATLTASDSQLTEARAVIDRLIALVESTNRASADQTAAVRSDLQPGALGPAMQSMEGLTKIIDQATKTLDRLDRVLRRVESGG